MLKNAANEKRETDSCDRRILKVKMLGTKDQVQNTRKKRDCAIWDARMFAKLGRDPSHETRCTLPFIHLDLFANCEIWWLVFGKLQPDLRAKVGKLTKYVAGRCGAWKAWRR